MLKNQVKKIGHKKIAIGRTAMGFTHLLSGCDAIIQLILSAGNRTLYRMAMHGTQSPADQSWTAGKKKTNHRQVIEFQ
jgi:hypothetical protein